MAKEDICFSHKDRFVQNYVRHEQENSIRKHKKIFPKEFR